MYNHGIGADKAAFRPQIICGSEHTKENYVSKTHNYFSGHVNYIFGPRCVPSIPISPAAFFPIIIIIFLFFILIFFLSTDPRPLTYG